MQFTFWALWLIWTGGDWIEIKYCFRRHKGKLATYNDSLSSNSSGYAFFKKYIQCKNYLHACSSCVWTRCDIFNRATWLSLLSANHTKFPLFKICMTIRTAISMIKHCFCCILIYPVSQSFHIFLHLLPQDGIVATYTGINVLIEITICPQVVECVVKPLPKMLWLCQYIDASAMVNLDYNSLWLIYDGQNILSG